MKILTSVLGVRKRKSAQWEDYAGWVRSWRWEAPSLEVVRLRDGGRLEKVGERESKLGGKRKLKI